MIVYYSRTGNTRLFAKALGEMTGQDTFELKQSEDLSGIKLFWRCITKKGVAVEALPDLSKDTTFTLCSPIWAATLSPFCMSMVKNLNLQGKTVHLLLTCGNSGSTEKYVANAKHMMEKAGCTVGAVFINPMKIHPKLSMPEMQEKLKDFVIEMEKEK